MKRQPVRELGFANEPFALVGQTMTAPLPAVEKVESKNQTVMPCGKQLHGFMPPCVLAVGHTGSCEDGFGGHYNH